MGSTLSGSSYGEGKRGEKGRTGGGGGYSTYGIPHELIDVDLEGGVWVENKAVGKCDLFFDREIFNNVDIYM